MYIQIFAAPMPKSSSSSMVKVVNSNSKQEFDGPS